MNIYGLQSICVIIIYLFIQLPPVNAQNFAHQLTSNLFRMEISSSLNPVGSGARAMGMGGAFIAVADDATAASWNPGGLIQLDAPETSFVINYTNRKEGNDFLLHKESNNRSFVDDFVLNYFSIAYPFNMNSYEMVVSLNLQRLYDFNRDWQFIFDHNTPGFTSPVQYNYHQTGNIYALGLAYSIHIPPDFSFGLTLNYNGKLAFQNKNWEQQYKQSGSISLNGISGVFQNTKNEEYSLKGLNLNLGFLWHITESWTLGGVLKTPYKADIDHQVQTSLKITYSDSPTNNIHQRSIQEYDEKLRMPLSYGLGVAYAFSDKFTFSFDIYRTHWNNFEFEHENGLRTSPITGKNINSTTIRPTTWFRMGGEYEFYRKNMVIPVRAGIFYDPSPDKNAPDDFYGFSLGGGLALESGIVFDLAYQFRTGNNVEGAMLENHDFSQDVREHKVYGSVIYYLR